MKNLMTNTLITTAFVALATTISLPSLAANEHDSHHAATATPARADTAKVDGVVKKVDKAAGKVTLSHGPLTNLDMPAMTMVFRVKDAAWLNQLTPGEKIRFVADQINGALTIVSFEAAK